MHIYQDLSKCIMENNLYLGLRNENMYILNLFYTKGSIQEYKKIVSYKGDSICMQEN